MRAMRARRALFRSDCGARSRSRSGAACGCSAAQGRRAELRCIGRNKGWFSDLRSRSHAHSPPTERADVRTTMVRSQSSGLISGSYEAAAWYGSFSQTQLQVRAFLLASILMLPAKQPWGQGSGPKCATRWDPIAQLPCSPYH